MVPYILALVFLIAIILWQVYSQTESFADTTTTLSPTMADYVNKISGFITRLENLVTKASSQTFIPKYSESELRLALPGPKDAPSPDLSTSEKFVKLLKGMIDFLKQDIERIKANPPRDFEEKYVVDSIPTLEKSVTYLENVYTTSTSGSTVPTTTSTTTSTTTTAEPKMLVNIYDLWGALGPFTGNKAKTTAADASGAEVTVVDVTKPKEKPAACSEPAKAEPQSVMLSNELEERISKNIAKQVKDELISQHQLQGATDDMSPYAPCDIGVSTDGIGQGSEFQQMRPQLATQETAPVYMKQPSINMNEYIRKDSIPCAKCNLSS